MGSIVGSGYSPAAENASRPDPGALSLTVPDPNGGNYTFHMSDLDELNYLGIETVIVLATQLGASIVLLIAMLLLTKPDKRFTPVFTLNLTSLFLNFLRLLLMCMYYTGPLNETYVALTGDVTSVPYSAYSTQIAAVVMTILLVVTVQTSLALQAQVVCLDMRRRYRRVVFAASACMALVAIGFRLAYGIVNCQFILTYENPENILWLEGANLNATAVSIFYFSFVFVAKLGFALWKRRKLGLSRWGPMQIVFTMGCQTLFIPALFAILQYCQFEIPEMDSNVLTLVALFLPLSAIWAASTIDGPSRSDALLNSRSTWGDGSTTRTSAALSGSSGTIRKEKRALRYSPSTTAASFVDAGPHGGPGNSAPVAIPDQGSTAVPIELALQPGRCGQVDAPYHELNG